MMLDFQHDFLDDTGRMPVSRRQVSTVLANASRLSEAFRSKGEAVIHVGNEFPESDWFMNLLRRGAAVAGTQGARWTEALPHEDATYFAKWRENAFSNPAIKNWFEHRNVEQLIIAGLFARACVATTARAALARGMRVILAGDAIACSSEASHGRSLDKLSKGGCSILTAADIIDWILSSRAPLDHR